MSAARRGGPPAPDAEATLATLTRAPLRPCYLLHGEDPFLTDRALHLLRRRSDAEAGPSTWRTLWADEDAAALVGAIDDLGAPMLFGGVAALVIRRAEALDGVREEAVLSVLPHLQGQARLILVARTLDARRKLPGAVARAGASVALAPVTDDATARRWVACLARDLGRDLAADAADLLVQRTGFDLGVLASEIEKASLFAGAGQRVEAAHVAATVAGDRAQAIEELTDRLARRDLGGAVRALRGLLGAGEPPIKVAAFLAASVRRALHVAELAEQGLGQEAIAQRLGVPPWLVRRSQGRGSAAHLDRALHALRRLDLELKTSRPAPAVFEAALFALAGKGDPGAATARTS
ncbi:MAG: DNA polymerase III subunit delta [bacterium]|nr:DNA polymerase III subunit delta [bacterium]